MFTDSLKCDQLNLQLVNQKIEGNMTSKARVHPCAIKFSPFIWNEFSPF